MGTEAGLPDLRELSDRLRRAAAGGAAKAVNEANRAMARRVVDTGKRLGGSSGHRATAKAADTLQVAARGDTVKVTFGGEPWMLGANFGAHHDLERVTRRGSMLGWNQFPAIKSDGDQFLYRAIKTEGPQLFRDYAALAEKLLDK